MPVTVEEIRSIIQEEFDGADVKDIEEKGHRIFGPIVWKGFRNMDVPQRNRLVAEKVRDRVGMRGINIGVLFPLAPGEKL